MFYIKVYIRIKIILKFMIIFKILDKELLRFWNLEFKVIYKVRIFIFWVL